ncbi:HemK2/MTQ2 family protein methyltransferase [Streptomyces sp. NPDC096013]|uniref:HemK2/MTQ2 family protein methyltransferase n=1 Tax=Streptomyces sp. NPDC096013 TaxID=3366069 RepID=UPI003808C29F
MARTWRLPGVYAPQADSFLLAEVMRKEAIGAGMDVLDVCTGGGVLALCAAQLGARVSAVDVSRRAVLSTRLNAALAGLAVTARRSDLLTDIADNSFDVVVSNPPYVPTPCARAPRRGARTAWDAGYDGRLLLDRICARAPAVLRPGGLLLLVHSAVSDVESTVRQLTEAGLRASVRERATIPFGPVMTGRLSWLRKRGLLSEQDTAEELVVVRATKE